MKMIFNAVERSRMVEDNEYSTTASPNMFKIPKIGLSRLLEEKKGDKKRNTQKGPAKLI